MARTTYIAAAALLAFLVLTGCAHRSTSAQPAGIAAATAAAAGTPTGGRMAVLHIVVQGAKKRANGYYSIQPSGGGPTSRTLFSVNNRGQWSSTVTAPPGSTLRVMLLDPRGSGTCRVTESGHGGQPNHTLPSKVSTSASAPS